MHFAFDSIRHMYVMILLRGSNMLQINFVCFMVKKLVQELEYLNANQL